jgi:hypothetical protein
MDVHEGEVYASSLFWKTAYGIAFENPFPPHIIDIDIACFDISTVVVTLSL